MYEKILVPVDIAHESSWKKAVPVAVELAEKFGGKVMLATVVRDFDSEFLSYFPPAYQWLIEKAQEKLKAIVNQCVPAEIRIDVLIGQGSISREIIRIANDHGIGLIVMASHRPELKDYLIGPNASAVVRHALCSVLVVRE